MAMTRQEIENWSLDWSKRNQMPDDILVRLNRWASFKPGDVLDVEGARDRAVALNTDIRDAIAEITYLRSLAGAVSDGMSMADIKAGLR